MKNAISKIRGYFIRYIGPGMAASSLDVFNFQNKFTTQLRPKVNDAPETFFGSVMSLLTGTIFKGFYELFTALAILYIMYSGIQYIQARSDPAKLKQARQSIIHTVLAVILVTAAYAIIAFIWGATRYVAGSIS